MKALVRYFSLFTLLLGFASRAATAEDMSEVDIAATPVAAGIYMLTGRGGNMGLSVGSDGVFLIDDQYAPLSDKILAAIATLSDQPVKFLINTHWHGDHTGGNENFGRRDSIIVAHDNVRQRLAAGGIIEAFKRDVPPAPAVALPVITFEQGITFHFNDETIRVEHAAAAHTDGDAIVYFEKANVVHMGDTFFNGIYPFIDSSSGGRMPGMIAAVAGVLQRIDSDTMVIPGHGPLADKAALQAYHDMLETVYTRVERLKSSGMKVEDIIAAQPTRDFDEQWGKGFLKPDPWVELIYHAL